MNKVKLSDSMTLGFALFAMFFGAGNLIFPPFLGFMSGDNWFIGFLCFIAADAGLSLLALFTVARIGHGAEGVTEVLGNKVSKLFLALTCLCIGPFIAIPRTGAITYELGAAPLVKGCSSWIVTGIFFLICLILSVRRASIVDVIGKILAPLMFIALLFLVFEGIAHPIGEISASAPVEGVIRDGITSGYQTMDMMGSAVFSMAIVFEITNKGYKAASQQFRIITFSGLICGLLLFIVYGGLAMLGATASMVYPEGITQTELLSRLTQDILGDTGLIVLALIVACACMTTAVGLLTSVSSFFSELTGNKVSYQTFVIIFSLFSWIISNFGISVIISVAAPILEVMYPIMIVLTVLRLFRKHIHDRYVYISAAAATAAVSLLSTVGSLTGGSLGTDKLPLADLGFEWLVPSIIVSAASLLVSAFWHSSGGTGTKVHSHL